MSSNLCCFLFQCAKGKGGERPDTFDMNDVKAGVGGGFSTAMFNSPSGSLAK